MRLSDHLIAVRGHPNDIGGIFTNMANAVEQAERFELSEDVVLAAYQLTKSKPTTLLKALPLTRAPFHKVWFEWRGGATTRSGMIRPENRRDPSFAPDPVKQGCLIETDETGQRGFMTFAWVHKERPERMDDEFYSPVNVSPLGTVFDWREDGDATAMAWAELQRRYPTKELRASPAGFMDRVMFTRYSRNLTDDQLRQWMERSAFHDWHKVAHVDRERQALQQLGQHEQPFISPHAHGFFSWVVEEAMKSEKSLNNFLNIVVKQSWELDIEGEPPFAETVIAMMNSRNAIEHRAVDLTGLNKARAKRKRPLFLPYRTTHLRLSQAQTRAFRDGLLTRAEAGHHRVRGHFKIRRTGVWWWSPFWRGDPERPIARQEYKVES